MTAIPSSNMVDLPVLSVLLVGGGVGVGGGSLGDVTGLARAAVALGEVGDVAHEVAADDVPVVVLPGVRVSGPSQGRAPLGVARQLDEGGGRGVVMTGRPWAMYSMTVFGIEWR